MPAKRVRRRRRGDDQQPPPKKKKKTKKKKNARAERACSTAGRGGGGGGEREQGKWSVPAVGRPGAARRTEGGYRAGWVRREGGLSGQAREREREPWGAAGVAPRRNAARRSSVRRGCQVWATAGQARGCVIVGGGGGAGSHGVKNVALGVAWGGRARPTVAEARSRWRRAQPRTWAPARHREWRCTQTAAPRSSRPTEECVYSPSSLAAQRAGVERCPPYCLRRERTMTSAWAPRSAPAGVPRSPSARQGQLRRRPRRTCAHSAGPSCVSARWPLAVGTRTQSTRSRFRQMARRSPRLRRMARVSCGAWALAPTPSLLTCARSCTEGKVREGTDAPAPACAPVRVRTCERRLTPASAHV